MRDGPKRYRMLAYRRINQERRGAGERPLTPKELNRLSALGLASELARAMRAKRGGAGLFGQGTG